MKPENHRNPNLFFQLLKKTRTVLMVIGLLIAFSSTVMAQASTSYDANTVPIGVGWNSAFGIGALSNLSSGTLNSAIGHHALFSNTSGSSNTAMGYYALRENTTGNANTAYGRGTLFSNTIGIRNTAIGYMTLRENVSGNDNTAVGMQVLQHNTIGYENTGNGYQALWSNITGNQNTTLGYRSGFNNQIGSGNVFLGYRAGYNETGDDRLYIDNSDTGAPLIWGDFAADALRFNGTVRIADISQNNGLTHILVEDADGDIFWRDAASLSGTDSQTLNYDSAPHTVSILGGNSINIAPFSSYPASAGDDGGTTNSYFGHQAGLINTGADNTFIGNNSGFNNSTGYENSSLGSRTLENNTTGARNTANGVFTLFGNTIGHENTAVGYAALGFNSTGNGNTATGFQALLNNSGNYNTALGYNAGTNGANYSNATAIGSGAIATASDMVRIGDATVTVIEGNVMFTVSDGRFKSNVNESDVKGLDFINRLRPVAYNFDTREFQEFLTKNMPDSVRQKHLDKDFDPSTAIRQSGFIAQEVVRAARESEYDFNGVHIPEDENGNYSLAYGQFVVPLVKGMQEQQAIIEALQQEVEALKTRLSTGATSSRANIQTFGTVGIASNPEGFELYQNIPNPFSETTVISAKIPEAVQQAKITIYNLQGLELESYALNRRGNVSVDISGGRFPSGMYLYALIADDRVIDTKKMILTE